MARWLLLLLGAGLAFRASLAAAALPAVQVQTLSGEDAKGTLVELGPQRITLDSGMKRVTLETEQVVALSPVDAPPATAGEPAAWVDLLDGSSLVAASVASSGGVTHVGLTGGRNVELPSRQVVAVRLRPHADATAAEWARLQESETASDVLVVRKGDSLDFHRGILREIGPAAVRFEVDGEMLPVKREKVFGVIICQAAARNLPRPVCHLVEGNGSTWVASTIGLEGEQVQWTTPLGLAVKRPLGELAKIDFSQGKIVYLSDLKPESVEWTPYIAAGKPIASWSEFFRPRNDQSLRSGPLELAGKPYKKGLALHSRTTMVYRLPGRFHRFKAVAGIDDRFRPRGSVRLVIRGDDQVLARLAVAGTDEQPQTIDVDLSGARRLTILADFGDDLDVAGHLDLCEARIVK
jgi:hypothetical protein